MRVGSFFIKSFKSGGGVGGGVGGGGVFLMWRWDGMCSCIKRKVHDDLKLSTENLDSIVAIILNQRLCHCHHLAKSPFLVSDFVVFPHNLLVII